MTDHTMSDGHEGGHASPRTYTIILVVLAVITLLEVGTYFWPWLHHRWWLLLAVLSVMAVAKFVLVVGWYMHLKYDAQYYRRVFIVPLILATAMIIVVTVLTALRFLL
jgi:cytochrome c oxidase subunit IV